MTVSSTTRSAIYAGNGVTTAFSFPYYWISDSHLLVQLRKVSDSSVTAWVLGTNYTLTGAGNLAGGTVTAIVAPAAGYNLEVYRTLPIVQTDDYVAHNTFPAETMEKDLDYLTMICQQLSDSIAAVAGGATLSFQNLGAGQGHVYAATAGNVVQLKSLKGAGATVVTESGTEITITSSASALDLTATYAWTGYHTWTKQAARTVPSYVFKSLQGGTDIVDSGILLASNYSALIDVRKNTSVSVEAPIGPTWGGVAGIYLQHQVSGTCNANGTYQAGYRSQLSTTQVRNGSAVNFAASGYMGFYNNGTDVDGAGLHVDAYHAGAFASLTHRTYGLALETYKNISGGLAAGQMVRSSGSYDLDFGISILNSGGAGGFGRGIQLGSPLQAQGGIPGSPGVVTPFVVGIDLSWGSYSQAAISVKANDRIVLSAGSAAQTTAVNDACNVRWNNITGNFEVRFQSQNRLESNMTNGLLYQNGNAFFGGWVDSGVAPWVLSTSGFGKVSATASSIGGGQSMTGLLANFFLMKIDGITVKVPYFG